MVKTKPKTNSTLFDWMLSGIERAGNKLPDPVTLFVILALSVVVISGICSAAGVSAIHPGTGEVITVTNLFSKSGLRMMWSKAVTNFSGFAPFGMVLVAVIGSGAAEKSGFLATLMQKLLAGAPPSLVTFVIMPPLAAIIFLGIGRHPFLGMFTAFASVSAGFCANIALGMSDALAYGFTEAAAKMIDPNYSASPALNYYFLVVSCIALSIVGTFITEKFMAPRFASADLSKYNFDISSTKLTPEQHKGLKAAGIAFIIFIAVFIFMCRPRPTFGRPRKQIANELKISVYERYYCQRSTIFVYPRCCLWLCLG